MHLPYSFLPSLEIHALLYFSEWSYFSLLRFIPFVHFLLHDLTRTSSLMSNTVRMGSISRLQRAKEIYIRGNAGHVHIEMGLENHSSCHRPYAMWASWTWTRFSFMAMSLKSKPNCFASWPWRCWRSIILLISTHRIGPALYHAFNDSLIRFEWPRHRGREKYSYLSLSTRATWVQPGSATPYNV